ncbi:BrnA antitoxin family protein [Lichenibacterium dinghuense]|uniref:BrnA antitoxin family protein n=1 Tax=Lichenibacterium dinghuense TaxID=2895977 RepID=UPI001F439AA2|nr:BrnA antitoxin family protein [Lichenibacterium sp. 6Y81]
MDESKRDTPIDLARIDAHVVSDREYEEVPELTDADFARGVWMPGGGDASAAARQLIDDDVLDRFRATGPGWERRINRILRDAAEALGPI